MIQSSSFPVSVGPHLEWYVALCLVMYVHLFDSIYFLFPFNMIWHLYLIYQAHVSIHMGSNWDRREGKENSLIYMYKWVSNIFASMHFYWSIPLSFPFCSTLAPCGMVSGLHISKHLCLKPIHDPMWDPTGTGRKGDWIK